MSPREKLTTVKPDIADANISNRAIEWIKKNVPAAAQSAVAKTFAIMLGVSIILTPVLLGSCKGSNTNPNSQEIDNPDPKDPDPKDPDPKDPDPKDPDPKDPDPKDPDPKDPDRYDICDKDPYAPECNCEEINPGYTPEELAQMFQQFASDCGLNHRELHVQEVTNINPDFPMPTLQNLVRSRVSACLTNWSDENIFRRGQESGFNIEATGTFLQCPETAQVQYVDFPDVKLTPRSGINNWSINPGGSTSGSMGLNMDGLEEHSQIIRRREIGDL